MLLNIGVFGTGLSLDLAAAVVVTAFSWQGLCIFAWTGSTCKM